MTEYIIKNNLSPAPTRKSEQTSTIALPSPIVSAKPIAAQNRISNPSSVSLEYKPDFEDIELTNMRKVIAKRLVLSKTTIPHAYISTTCKIDKVITLRKEMIANGQKVSLNDFIIKAAGLTLKVKIH